MIPGFGYDRNEKVFIDAGSAVTGIETYPQKKVTKKIDKTVSIDAAPARVWEYLTKPTLMKNWMGDPGMRIEITTDWVVGTPILIRGFHHVDFENKGIVLQFESPRVLRFTHLSSISRLPDTKENHSVITFAVTPGEKETTLNIQVESFPTETIYKHLNFYWQGTMIMLKDLIEREDA